jgi:hypothetical protein
MVARHAYRGLVLTPGSCSVLMTGMIEYGELSFKVVRLEPGGQEVIARAGNYEICKAAFDKALFVYPTQHIELRQGTRVICKSKEG